MDRGLKMQRISAEAIPHRDYHRGVSAQNRRGEWVPAIPLPLFGVRKRCSCGAKFWTLKGYQGHYALEHVLGFDP